MNNGIRLQNLFVDGRHIILDNAEAGVVAFFSIQTAGYFLFDQDNLFHPSARLSGACQGVVEKNIAVAADPRTSHNAENFHRVILLIHKNSIQDVRSLVPSLILSLLFVNTKIIEELCS